MSEEDDEFEFPGNYFAPGMIEMYARVAKDDAMIQLLALFEYFETLNKKK